MDIAIPVYHRFTALDAIGPYEVLSRLPGATVHFVAVEPGPVQTMGLVLAARIAGDDVAQAIQLGIEYDPQPPFDSGSVRKAPPHLVELVREIVAAEEAAA